MNSITRGDALELIHRVSDSSIDLIVCDGPYGVTTNRWDNVACSIQEYNLQLIKLFSSKLKIGGSLYLFGKSDCIDFIDYRPYLYLRRKIIWFQPSRLSQGKTNYTNNYDLICFFTKGSKANIFNLDAIRIPQLVDLTHRNRCEKVPSVTNGTWGKTKFNDMGKNPGDVWGDIKQLTYKSKELVSRDALNTIQKPEELIKRLIFASSDEGDLVLDPFTGTGTCPALCARYGRDYIAFEMDKNYVRESRKRVAKELYLKRQIKLKRDRDLFNEENLYANNKSNYQGA